MQATWSQPVAEVVVFSIDFASRRDRPRHPWDLEARSVPDGTEHRGMVVGCERATARHLCGAVPDLAAELVGVGSVIESRHVFSLATRSRSSRARVVSPSSYDPIGGRRRLASLGKPRCPTRGYSLRRVQTLSGRSRGFVRPVPESFRGGLHAMNPVQGLDPRRMRVLALTLVSPDPTRRSCETYVCNSASNSQGSSGVTMASKEPTARPSGTRVLARVAMRHESEARTRLDLGRSVPAVDPCGG